MPSGKFSLTGAPCGAHPVDPFPFFSLKNALRRGGVTVRNGQWSSQTGPVFVVRPSGEPREERLDVARFQCYRTGESRIRWRLVGGNNRLLGVGVQWHAEQEDALAEIERVRSVAPEAAVRIEHAESGLWWWKMATEESDLAGSAQGFARRIDAELAVKRFRHHAPLAELVPGLAVFPAGGRGRLLPTTPHVPPRSPTAEGPDVSPQRPVT